MLIIFCIIIITGCSEKASEYFDPRGTDYAGSNECISCHKKIHNDFIHTGHFNSTSEVRLAEFEMLHKTGQTLFTYTNGESIQLGYKEDLPALILSQRDKPKASYVLNVAFGFRHAQTFGYWNTGKLYEHSLSYYKEPGKWGTSPGFPSDEAYFDRRIPKDCFACHTSNASDKSMTIRSDQRNFTNIEMSDNIDAKTIVHGIDCERCHGPGKDHAEAAKKKSPKESIARYSQMTRQQRLDACAVCHSGNDGIKMKSRFEFRPGDLMSNFYSPSPNTEFDVHGNQYGLLTQSKCFQKSQAMDCMTCHDPHKDKPANDKVYNQSCISCHSAPKHSSQTVASNSASYLRSNCISCHMPSQESRAVKYKLNGEELPRGYLLRTHKIGLYPKSTQKI